MPHLSPMNWLIAPILFMLFMLPLLTSYMWWCQTPNFPSMKNDMKPKLNLWNWT